MTREILKQLSYMGVDPRFISIYDKHIYINNLRFSRFSRKKEDQLKSRYPDWKVVRSKVFQKMCIRASRILSQIIKPGDEIYVKRNKECADIILYLILEPYQRKYGIEIICLDGLDDLKEGIIAMPLTLDHEVGNIIHQIFNGEQIKLTGTETGKENIKVIHPLINIPNSWIMEWASKEFIKCSRAPMDKVSDELIRFLEPYIPDVRENMLKSAHYLS
ncbi:MAG: ATPase [Methanobacterium sp.]|jgi:hypothetical protein|nr:ATPase [Methanobacterium sp.]